MTNPYLGLRYRGLLMRPLRFRDAFWCWRLANDPGVRRVSVDSTPPTPCGHLRWMWTWAGPGHPDHWAVAVEAGGEPVGHLRIGPGRRLWTDERELHVSLLPSARGYGYGARVLEAARHSVESFDDVVSAYVREDNVSALRAFRAAGWTERGVSLTYATAGLYIRFTARP